MKLKKGNQRIFLLQWLAKSDPVAPSDLLLPFGNQEIKLLAFAPNLCCPSPDLMGLELVIMHMTSQLLFLECSLANFEVVSIRNSSWLLTITGRDSGLKTRQGQVTVLCSRIYLLQYSWPQIKQHSTSVDTQLDLNHLELITRQEKHGSWGTTSKKDAFHRQC